MAKQTKSQRITEKVKAGLSHIEAEIEIAQEDNAAKIAALKAKKDKEDARERERVVVLLEDEQPELFEQLRSKARHQLAQETRQRRDRHRGTSHHEPLRHESVSAGVADAEPDAV